MTTNPGLMSCRVVTALPSIDALLTPAQDGACGGRAEGGEPGRMHSDLGKRIRSFLASHHVVSLATAGPSGPHAASLFYACDDLSLVWVSDPNTRHSREIEACPRVAATVSPDYDDFAQIKGLQIAGMARRVVADAERSRQFALLEASYPFLRDLSSGSEKLRGAFARASIYRLEPTSIVMIDNARGFAHKSVLDLAGTPVKP